MTRPVYETSEAAEAAFYEAFASADLEAMMAVWDDDEAIVCIHPSGPRIVGPQAIEESWAQIFKGGMPMAFRVSEAILTVDANLAVHCIHENIDFGEGLRHHSVVLATNVYRLTDSGWRMTMHHATPAIPLDEEDDVEDEAPRVVH